MRTSKRPACASLFSILLLPAMIAAVTIDCEHIKVKGRSFNLSPLKGPHQVKFEDDMGEIVKEITFTIDLCTKLDKISGEPSDHQCPSGTRVCGIERVRTTIDNHTDFAAAMPIAGELANYEGPRHGLDPSWTLLSESESTSDAGLEGLRLTMRGGRYPLKKTGDKMPKDQQAIIELICDKDRTGLEGEMKNEDKYESDYISARADDAETPSDSSKASLEYVSYPGKNEKVDTLRLTWRSKYACEDEKDKTDAAQRGSWGFFTWFFFIAFLGTAAYLIFGSWLNYTRYGARGWDLLPHGDTIRDVPYLMKDWTRKVVNTVQGGGSRGGYAAV